MGFLQKIARRTSRSLAAAVNPGGAPGNARIVVLKSDYQAVETAPIKMETEE